MPKDRNKSQNHLDIAKWLLTCALVLFLLLQFVGCKKHFPDDLSVGKYEVIGTYVYPNDSIVSETLTYYGPQKAMGDIRFTLASSGFSRLVSFRQGNLESGNVSFQIENLNSGSVSHLSCSFESEVLQTDYLKINFTTTTQQGEVNFLSGTLTFKKI